MDGRVLYNAVWKHCLRRLTMQFSSWYATPSRAICCRFMAILYTELQGVLSRSWNSERPLIFSHAVFKNTLGVCRDIEIRAIVTRRMDLWERDLHAGLVGEAKVEGASRESNDAIVGSEEN